MALPFIYSATVSRRTNPLQDEIAKSVERGKDVYTAQCMSCHQLNGEGLSGVYPPLAGSDHLTRDQEKSILIIRKKYYRCEGDFQIQKNKAKVYQ